MGREVPKHIGIIMDGNGRWAKKRFLPRAMGHRQGAQALDKLTKEAEGLGVEYITVYAFSTENWKRSKDEVDSIMGLLREYINRFFNDKKSILKIRSAGDLTALSPDLQADIEKLKEQSKDRPGMTLTIAINYGGRDEIRRAVTKIAEDVKAGKIQPEDINDQMVFQTQNLLSEQVVNLEQVTSLCGSQLILNTILQINFGQISMSKI